MQELGYAVPRYDFVMPSIEAIQASISKLMEPFRLLREKLLLAIKRITEAFKPMLEQLTLRTDWSSHYPRYVQQPEHEFTDIPVFAEIDIPLQDGIFERTEYPIYKRANRKYYQVMFEKFHTFLRWYISKSFETLSDKYFEWQAGIIIATVLFGIGTLIQMLL